MEQTRTLRTIDEAFEVIDSLGGKIFGATFVKKNGEVRDMNARRGVQKHLAGGELKFDPRARGMLSVFDLKANGYRMINLATLREIRAGGTRYVASY